jgi:phage terminase large subunit GpA-like protein
MTSSPTIRGASRVEQAWLASDQREYEVPWPGVRASSGKLPEFKMHAFAWDRIEWPEGKPEDAARRCPACGELIPHHLKDGMVSRGRWRVSAPIAKTTIAGFQLSELVSPWRS